MRCALRVAETCGYSLGIGRASITARNIVVGHVPIHHPRCQDLVFVSVLGYLGTVGDSPCPKNTLYLTQSIDTLMIMVLLHHPGRRLNTSQKRTVSADIAFR